MASKWFVVPRDAVIVDDDGEPVEIQSEKGRVLAPGGKLSFYRFLVGFVLNDPQKFSGVQGIEAYLEIKQAFAKAEVGAVVRLDGHTADMLKSALESPSGLVLRLPAIMSQVWRTEDREKAERVDWAFGDTIRFPLDKDPSAPA